MRKITNDEALEKYQPKLLTKKVISLIVVIVILSTIILPSLTVANPDTIVIKLWVGNQFMEVNGVRKAIDAQGTKPVIIESRTLVPIRAIVEALGGTVDWDANERKVTISLSSTLIELWIENPTAKVNGIDTLIDPQNPKVVPKIINSRTMLPIRFVSENLGCTVSWDSSTKTVTIIYQASLSDTSESKTITPASGGTVELKDGASITVPSEGVDKTATLKIKTVEKNQTEDKGVIGNIYDITIEGGKLQKEATVKLPIPSGYQDKDTVISYWDEQEKLWTIEGGKEMNGYLVLNIDHFSKRGITLIKEADTHFSVENNGWHFVNADGSCYGMDVTAGLAFKQHISIPTATNPYCLPTVWSSKIKEAQRHYTSIAFPQLNSTKFSILQRELCDNNNLCTVAVLYPHAIFFGLLPGSHDLLAYSLKRKGESTDEWLLNVYDPNKPCNDKAAITIKETENSDGSINYNFQSYDGEASITNIRGLTDIISLNGVESSTTMNCTPNVEIKLSEPLSGDIDINKEYEFYVNIINNSTTRAELFGVIIPGLPSDILQITNISTDGKQQEYEVEVKDGKIIKLIQVEWGILTIPQNTTIKLSFKIKFRKVPNSNIKSYAFCQNIYESMSECGIDDQKNINIDFLIYEMLYPDLIAESMSWTPSSAKEGDSVKFTTRIKNQGKSTANSFDTRLDIGGTTYDTKSISSLSADSSTTITFKSWNATAGCKDINVTVDSGNSVNESNENNNIKSEQICVNKVDLKLGITVDKGCGSTYCINDPIRICFSSNQSGTAYIIDKIADGSSQAFGPYNLNANITYCMNGKITPPAGTETLILKFTSSSGIYGEAQCSFIVSECGSCNEQVVFSDDFCCGLSNWNLWGSPKPYISNGEFAPNGDSWYDSGAISKNTFNIKKGISVEADLKPGSGSSFMNADFALSTGAIVGEDEPDWIALVDVGGGGEGIVDFQVKTEYYRLTNIDKNWHNYKILVRSEDYRVEFYMDGKRFWTSTTSLSDYTNLYITVLGRGGARIDNIKVK